MSGAVLPHFDSKWWESVTSHLKPKSKSAPERAWGPGIVTWRALSNRYSCRSYVRGLLDSYYRLSSVRCVYFLKSI